MENSNDNLNESPKNNKIKFTVLIIFLALIGMGVWLYLGSREIKAPEEIKEIYQNQQIQVALKINTGENLYEFNEKIKKDATVFDLMKNTSAKEGFPIDYKDSSTGVFIDGVYGVKNDNQTQKYWTFLVNGKFAEVGASQYKLNVDDVVEWKYGGL